MCVGWYMGAVLLSIQYTNSWSVLVVQAWQTAWNSECLSSRFSLRKSCVCNVATPEKFDAGPYNGFNIFSRQIRFNQNWFLNGKANNDHFLPSFFLYQNILLYFLSVYPVFFLICMSLRCITLSLKKLTLVNFKTYVDIMIEICIFQTPCGDFLFVWTFLSYFRKINI